MSDQLPPVDNKYLPFWTEGTVAICIKDNPPMYGFGRKLKVGDRVTVKGVCYGGGGAYYDLSIPAECAFYKMEDYFEVAKE